MRIGIDFDNTIAWYDEVFVSAANEAGLPIPSGLTNKREIRDIIRELEGGDEKWKTLQAIVYGERMAEASLMPGVARFLTRCRDEMIDVYIVSHKTKFANVHPSSVNLRDAARKWLASRSFHDLSKFAIPTDHVFFEDTREKKIRRIEQLTCTHFIDDLIEVLDDQCFPKSTKKYHFAGTEVSSSQVPKGGYRHWDEITDAIFNGETV